MTNGAGYIDNQEDSIIINKSAIDRGLFRIYTYKAISTSEKKHASNDNQVIQMPPEEVRVNHKYCYDKLDKDGLVAIGERVEEFDVLVGKVRVSGEEIVQDCSVICKSNEHGVVDDVCVTINEKGYKHVKIRIRRERVPEIGDKFCHVSAQKGTCLVGTTRVTLTNGSSKMIKDVGVGDAVWGYNGYNGLETSVCTNKAYMGTKQVFKITTQTGVFIEATSDHKILTRRGWIETSDLDSTDYIAANLDTPLDIVGNDETGWSLTMRYNNQCGDHVYQLNMDTEHDRLISLAFARVLGYMLTDGWLCRDNRRINKYRSGVALGTMIDAKIFIEDVKLISDAIGINCRDEPRFYDSKSFAGACFVYDLPNTIANFMASLDGIPIGRRIDSPASLPTFIESSPLSFIREFLGGFFGGHGCAPYLSSRELHRCNVMWKCKDTHVNALNQYMNKIKHLLHVVGVKSCITKPKVARSKAKDGCQRFVIGLNLYRTSDFLKIGFRYCLNKQLRLCAATSFWKMRAYMDGTKEGLGRNGGNAYKLYEWLTQTGADKLFEKGCHSVHRDSTSIPYFYIPIEKIEIHGVEDVYDITVDKLHSFIANGLVVHNCGMIYAQEDMPFSQETGLSPEIIINAHCLPSRMTINMVMEMLSGKAAAITGEIHDATAFQEPGETIVEELQEKLKEFGYSPSGSESFINGMTGRPLEAKIFTGMGYYQRLKHMVDDKIHARSKGNVQMLSRQPCSGRAREGGLRFGEMVLISVFVFNVVLNYFVGTRCHDRTRSQFVFERKIVRHVRPIPNSSM